MSFLGIGGGNQNNTANLTQNIINSMYQQSTQQCLATCQNIAIGNTIVVNNVNIGGDFTGYNQVCNAQAACVMEQNLSSSAQNVLDALLKQENSTISGPFTVASELLGGSNQTNTVKVQQTISNMMQQNLSSFCQTYSSEIAEGNVLFLGGSNNTIKGNFIGINQTSSANASCTMKNFAKMVAYNQSSADITQSNKQVDTVALIGLILGAIVVFIIIVVVILLLTGVIRFGENGTSSGASNVTVTAGQPQYIALPAAAEGAAVEGAEMGAV